MNSKVTSIPNTCQTSIKLDPIAICHNSFTNARDKLVPSSIDEISWPARISNSRGIYKNLAAVESREAFACFSIDRRDRYRKSWRCETERATTLDPRQCRILLSLSFFSSPPFLFSSLPFILFLFRVVFVSQIIDRAIRDAHASETKSEGREREMVLRLKEVATDVEVTTSVCQRRLTIRIFRYFYRSNVLLRQYCSSSFLFCLFLNDLPRYIYISFNSLLALIRCSRGISQAASVIMIRIHDLLLLRLWDKKVTDPFRRV